MDHMFTLTGTTLTVHLPSEVDHHSTEQLQREMDQLQAFIDGYKE